MLLLTPEEGTKHVKNESLGADQQGIDVHTVTFGIEWSFVQNEHDMKHSSIANEIEIGCHQRPELEAFSRFFIHLSWVANQGQSKQYIGHDNHHDANHLADLHVLHIAELCQNSA